MVSPFRKEEPEPVARPFSFSWAAGGERGLVAAMAPAAVATVNRPVINIKPAMLVTLKVQDTQRRVVSRTMRRTDKLQDIMDFYYDVVCSADAGGTRGAGRFVFDGKKLKGEQTPEDLGMKSGDQIDFFGDGSGDAEEEEVDRKPVIRPGPVVHVTVKVQDMAGRTFKFIGVRTTQKLQVIMNAYYARVPDITKGTGKFLSYDGRQLKGEQTPAELQMEGENEIEIDFVYDMMGGGGLWAAAAAAEQPPVHV